MGRRSREKGKVGEREAAEVIRAWGFEARRGQQYRGGPESPDVVHSIPGVYASVKRREKLAVCGALREAEAEMGEGEIALVLHRRSREPWQLTLRASDLPALCARFMMARRGGSE